MISLAIPFVQNRPSKWADSDPKGNHCQEASLQSILSYFKPDSSYGFEQMCEITGRNSDKAVWAFGYSLWLTDNGFEVQRITTVDYKAFARQGIDYIRDTYGDEIADWQEQNTNFEKALQLADQYIDKVDIVTKSPQISDIESAMVDGWLAKVMIDSGVVEETGQYLGHSVVVTGVESDSVIYHENGMPPIPDRKVTQELFQVAIDAFGGEMDLIRPLPA